MIDNIFLVMAKIFLVFLGFGLIILSDLCLQKVAKVGIMKGLLSKEWLKTILSYIIGLFLFIIIIKIAYAIVI